MKLPIALTSILVSLLHATEPLPMPPMVPSLPGTSSPTSVSALPKSCEIIPPMIYKLPPPLENALRTCNNDLKKPTEAFIKEKFGNHIKNITIEALEGFSQVYLIAFEEKGKQSERFCNETLTFCFDKKPIKK